MRVLVLLIVSACATHRPPALPPQPIPAPVPTEGSRSISLYFAHTHESAEGVYRTANGDYDDGVMLSIAWLMRDHETGEVHPIDPALIDIIADLRDRLNLPPSTMIEVVSGYRSPLTNASMVKTNHHVAVHSLHTQGKAADVRIPGVDGAKLHAIAASLHEGGHAFYPGTGHVHVDTGPDRTWSTE